MKEKTKTKKKTVKYVNITAMYNGVIFQNEIEYIYLGITIKI